MSKSYNNAALTLHIHGIKINPKWGFQATIFIIKPVWFVFSSTATNLLRCYRVLN
jgi:hypothetical protein